MPLCPHCSHHLVRSHRSLLQRLIYSEAYNCRKCGYVGGAMRASLRGTIDFLTSRHSKCIACGNLTVQRLSKRDRIDTMSKHPFSLALGLTLAPINRCPLCRLQYRDWRRPDPRARHV